MQGKHGVQILWFHYFACCYIQYIYMHFGFNIQYNTKWIRNKAMPWQLIILQFISSEMYSDSSSTSPLLFFIYLFTSVPNWACSSPKERNQHRGSTNTDAVLLGTVNRPVAASYADCLTNASDEFTWKK
jgi:hypothetical protein